MTRIARLSIVLAVLLASTTTTRAGSWFAWPSGSAEVKTSGPALDGMRANAPIPPEYHTKNEGGSDDAGLCVISSVLTAGRFQGVPGLEAGKGSKLWRTAKSEPGGYFPEKLARLIERTNPGEKYASISGTDPRILDRLSRQGYALCMTMNTGELYNNQSIHHMVNYPHYDSGRNVACFYDNNDPPNVYRWITAQEAARRWIDGGTGWVFVWLRRHPAAAVASGAVLLLAAAVFLLAAVRANDDDDFSHEGAIG